MIEMPLERAYVSLLYRYTHSKRQKEIRPKTTSFMLLTLNLKYTYEHFYKPILT